MNSSSAGYSGTPLAKKLGIVAGTHVLPVSAPENYAVMLAPLPIGIVFEKKLTARTNVIHVFCDAKKRLEAELGKLRSSMRPETAVWVSWPKKASKVPTDITEDTIRDIALPLGFVDIKVCAVNDIWSALKLVIRKELR